MMGLPTAPPRNMHERRQMLNREIRCGMDGEAQDRAITIIYGLLDEIATFERTVGSQKFLIERLEERIKNSYDFELKCKYLETEIESVKRANSMMTDTIEHNRKIVESLTARLEEDEVLEIAKYWSNTAFVESAERFLLDFARGIEEKKNKLANVEKYIF